MTVIMNTSRNFQERMEALLVSTPGCTKEYPNWAKNEAAKMVESQGMYSWGYSAAIVDLPTAAAIFKAGSEYKDFVYIAPWRSVIFNVTAISSHEMFLGKMFTFFEACKTGKGWDDCLASMCFDVLRGGESIRDISPRFIDNCYGFFLSSVSHDLITISSSYVKNAQEKAVFKSFRFREI